MKNIATALLLTLLLTGSAAAATVEATSGVVLGFARDTFINIQGDDFSLISSSGNPFIRQPDGGQVPVFAPAFVVDGTSIPSTPDFHGSLRMFHAVPAGWPALPPNEPFVTSFLMTGHVDLGGGFDLFGQGTVALGPIVSDALPYATYTFTTPEPSTLLLLSGAVGAVAVRSYRHRRRQGY